MKRYKTILWVIFLIAAIAEIGTLFLMRSDFRGVQAEGAEFITPVTVNFKRNFYESNYVALYVPVQKARWIGTERPADGERVYLSISKDSKNRLQVLHAQQERPRGDYITVRAKGLDGGMVHFNFPTDRFYMDAAQIRRLSISELAERVQVRDADTGKVVSRMKNSITARLRVRDGEVVIQDLLVNGNPIQESFTTVGTNADIKYASSEKEKDRVIPAAGEMQP